MKRNASAKLRKPKGAPGLLDARRKIDDLDSKILDLLAARADVAREVADIKRAARVQVFHDPERERQVLDRLVAHGGKRFPADAIRAVFREVMSACLSFEEPLRVAYLGPEGTFSQMAARSLFGLQARYRECATGNTSSCLMCSLLSTSASEVMLTAPSVEFSNGATPYVASPLSTASKTASMVAHSR